MYIDQVNPCGDYGDRGGNIVAQKLIFDLVGGRDDQLIGIAVRLACPYGEVFGIVVWDRKIVYILRKKGVVGMDKRFIEFLCEIYGKESHRKRRLGMNDIDVQLGEM